MGGAHLRWHNAGTEGLLQLALQQVHGAGLVLLPGRRLPLLLRQLLPEPVRKRAVLVHKPRQGLQAVVPQGLGLGHLLLPNQPPLPHFMGLDRRAGLALQDCLQPAQPDVRCGQGPAARAGLNGLRAGLGRGPIERPEEELQAGVQVRMLIGLQRPPLGQGLHSGQCAGGAIECAGMRLGHHTKTVSPTQQRLSHKSGWRYYHYYERYQKRGGGGGGSRTQKFVYQKWPKKIFPIVNFVFFPTMVSLVWESMVGIDRLNVPAIDMFSQ